MTKTERHVEIDMLAPFTGCPAQMMSLACDCTLGLGGDEPRATPLVGFSIRR